MAKKKKNATRRLLTIVIGLVVILVLVAVVGNATGMFGEKEEGTKVEIAEVDLRDVTQVVTASGKVQPEVEVQISPDVSGEIIDLPVKEGDKVKRGALLAKIDPDFYQAQVEQAQAGVSQARANAAQRRADMLNAEVELKRQKDLLAKDAVSQSDYDRADTQYQVSQAAYEAAQFSVESAAARLREAEEQLSQTIIFSPMDATVSMLAVELGERVVGTSQMQGTVMMTVARLNQMEIEIDVNENDVVNVAIGDTAAVEVDAYPERSFKGIVTEIANTARVQGAGSQEQVTNFPVKVRILDPHNIGMAPIAGNTSEGVALAEVPTPESEVPTLRPGMSGTVDIYTQTDHNAIAIPIQAVTVRDFNKVKEKEEGEDAEDEDADEAESNVTTIEEEDLRKVVFVMDENKAKMVAVETGISDDTHIVVKSGLQGAEKVIIGPFRVVSRTLEPGDAVRVETDDDDKRGPFGGAD